MKPIEELFWAKVNKQGPVPEYKPDLGSCWLWLAYTDRDGYGHFGNNRAVSRIAHRFSYIQTNGPLPFGKPLDHLCRVRSCVNPAHLELVTPKINNSRGEKARQTHCINGHKFTESNTYIKPTVGTRVCKACRDIRAIANRNKPGYKEEHAAYERARRARLREIDKCKLN